MANGVALVDTARAYGTSEDVIFGKTKPWTLEAAVRKMTGQPARVLGLQDRGLIRTGFAADLTIFDPAVVIDKGTYAEPVQFPAGIEHVMVNGQWAVISGKETGVRSGRVLRKGRA